MKERIARIRSANRRVWITTPYFVPRLSLVRALRKAARSGVDVRILLPSKSDVIFMDWVNTAYYSVLLIAGIRIYEYQPRMIHAKIIIADDWVTVGSTNLNHRSMIHDLEADVVLTHPESLAEIEGHFREDLKASREITLEKWEQGSASRKVAGKLLFLFRYWM